MEYMNGYSSSLTHSQGNWKKHEYSGKVTKGGNTYYMYSYGMNRSKPYNKGLYKSSVSKYGMVRKGRLYERPEKEKAKEEEKKKVLNTAESTKLKKENDVKEKKAKGGGAAKEKVTKQKQEAVVQKKPEKIYKMVESKNKKSKEYLDRYASKRKYSKEEVDKIKEKERLKQKKRK